MTEVEITLLVSWVLTLLLTPAAIRLAPRLGWMDQPSERKQHTAPVPLAGGLAVLAAACLSIAGMAVWSPAVRASLWGLGSLSVLGVLMFGVVLLGFLDDLWDVRAAPRLAAQVLLAGLAWALGFQVGAIELPFGWELENIPLVSFCVTVAWIVLITNAFNFIDGVDGLTAGVGCIAALMIVWLPAIPGYQAPALGGAALAGALAGFLRFNLFPARIFLGDAGAMGIGFAIGVLSLASSQKGPTAVAAVVPLLGLGLPLLDAGLAILRRARRHLRTHALSGLRPSQIGAALMSADRGHIHHLLLRSGWSVRRVVFFLYAVSVALTLFALWSRGMSTTLRWGVWLLMLAAGLAMLWVLERRVERREGSAPPSGGSA